MGDEVTRWWSPPGKRVGVKALARVTATTAPSSMGKIAALQAAEQGSTPCGVTARSSNREDTGLISRQCGFESRLRYQSPVVQRQNVRLLTGESRFESWSGSHFKCSASSTGRARGPHPRHGGSIPSLSTVAKAQQAEHWAVIPEAAASSNLASHPERRWQSGNAAASKAVASMASVVQIHPGALMLPWSRRIGHCPPA
jgi:hypothetical protein